MPKKTLIYFLLTGFALLNARITYGQVKDSVPINDPDDFQKGEAAASSGGTETFAYPEDYNDDANKKFDAPQEPKKYDDSKKKNDDAKKYDDSKKKNDDPKPKNSPHHKVKKEYSPELFGSLGYNKVDGNSDTERLVVPNFSLGGAFQFKYWDILALRLEGEVMLQHNYSDSLNNGYDFSTSLGVGLRAYWKFLYLGTGINSPVFYLNQHQDSGKVDKSFFPLAIWYGEVGSDIDITERNYLSLWVRFSIMPIGDLYYEPVKGKSTDNHMISLYFAYGYRF